MKHINFKLTISLLLILVVSITIIGQENKMDEETPFSEVPSKIRIDLIERFNLFINYQITKNWENIYLMLGEQYKKSVDNGLTKEKYLKQPPHLILKKFTPKNMYLLLGTEDEGWWMIEGCGEYKKSGKLKSTIEAYRQNEEWFFSDPGVVFSCIHCEPQKCKHSE